MPDFNLTQAQYDEIAERLFYTFSKVLTVQELRKRFELTATRVMWENDTADTADNIALTGVDIGVNTDADGVIYVRITDETPGAGQATFDLYKATGGGAGDKVATGNAADGATITLSASNSSGMGGTIDMGTIAASDTTDNLKIRCFTDFPVRDRQVFNDDQSEDAEVRTRIQQTNSRVASSLRSVEGTLLSDATYCLGRYVANQDDMSTSTVAVNLATKNSAGAISSIVTGILEDLRDHMATNSTAQTIVKNTVSAAAAVFNSNNDGQGTMSITVLENIEPGVITFECVDETVGSERFEVRHRNTEDNVVVSAANRLQIEQTFRDPRIGIGSCTISRTYTKTGDGSHTELDTVGGATTQALVITGLNASNSNDGVLYWKTSAGTTNNDVEFFKAASLDDSQLVACATSIADATQFTATAQNNSGLTILWATGSNPAYTNGTLDCNTFRTGPPRDKVTVDISRTTTGFIQKFIADYYDWYINSTTSGSETLGDSFILRGGPVLENRNS